MTFLRSDGTARIRLIAPGKGSSGWYSPEVLQRAAGRFSEAKSFIDHQTRTQESERPEGSLRDLVGQIVGTPVYESNGASGPGLYGNLKVFSHWQPFVEELAPYIGVSIRASGKTKAGDVGGQQMPIVEDIVSAKSVDLVVAAGAGGKLLSEARVVELFEAARDHRWEPGGASGRSGAVAPLESEKDMQELEEARSELATTRADLARLRERLLLREAADTAAKHLRSVELPDVTKERLVSQLSMRPPVKDGDLDEAAFIEQIREAVRSESTYIAQITESGRVRGMGSAPGATDIAEATKTLEANLQRLGAGNGSGLRAAVQGRG